ncbi:MAG: hypothetical protein OJF51_004412 [Nitrospira sp.]|nr:MAG: hypothetical protein OJF51_004412 [Nitrospira sp.]
MGTICHLREQRRRNTVWLAMPLEADSDDLVKKPVLWEGLRSLQRLT